MPCKEEEDDSQISQNLNENLTEHEVVTWTVTGFLRSAGAQASKLGVRLTGGPFDRLRARYGEGGTGDKPHAGIGFKVQSSKFKGGGEDGSGYRLH